MQKEIKKYYLFIDESGDHGLVKLDPIFLFFYYVELFCPKKITRK